MLRNPLCAVVMGLCALMVVSEQSYARDLTDAEKQVIADAVKARLRDPASATFKWGSFVGQITETATGANSSTYCGMVNSRNGFGGYGGDTPYMVFIVLLNERVAISHVVGMSGQATYAHCRSYGYDPLYFAGIE